MGIYLWCAAVDTKQSPLRKRIFDAYKKKNAKNKLFYELAGVNAVKFLYGRGWKSAHLINNAFVCASTNGKTNTVELLLNTGLITGKFLNDAFEAAAGFIGGVHLERVAFLYNNRRTCLRTLGNEDNTKPIRQEEHISDDTAIKAFEKAAASGDNTYSNIRDKSKIVKLLNKEQCIPYEMICKAFVAAVSNGNTDVVGHLRDDHRFSSESMAVKKALIVENPDVMKYLVILLTEEGRVPRVWKHQALVPAAMKKITYALFFLTSYEMESGLWTY
ncbi:hypothetical protein PPTG_11520 [Phytophthora nicotianae INRA-310]|uniref:Uncharacterized protein n=1 Tax=Phytophthora nicotianae (strain INRA-310) TaxID=761204 RepID=W2Q8S2_PHYN3|nr:hypothetical protein PPTG_11520 [Phytophthora nicotianae INRA-310]ETN08665.1 hypothetical protein PPTG_11520 [Phytophthora nicotianae INRA-310]